MWCFSFAPSSRIWVNSSLATEHTLHWVVLLKRSGEKCLCYLWGGLVTVTHDSKYLYAGCVLLVHVCCKPHTDNGAKDLVSRQTDWSELITCSLLSKAVRYLHTQNTLSNLCNFHSWNSCTVSWASLYDATQSIAILKTHRRKDI